jgi:hypothetical protein
MESVVVISFNEDGDPPSVTELSKEEFRKRLREDYYGSRPVFAEPGKPVDSDRFVGLVVIEGKIVKPKAVQVTTEYDL